MSAYEDIMTAMETMRDNNVPNHWTPKLYADNERQAELWRKMYPGVEVLISERVPYPELSLTDYLEKNDGSR